MKQQVFWVTPNLTNGGAERVTAVLANALANDGWNTTVVYMKDDKSVYDLNENVKRAFIYGSGNTWKRVAGKIICLRRMMKSNPKAVFVAMLPFESLYMYLAGIGLKNRKIYSLRNDPANMSGTVDKFVMKTVYPSADGVVFQTQTAMDYFPSKVREKGVIIPNPISEELPKPFNGEKTKEFAAVGRLSPQKNYEMMLRAFAEVHKKYPEWKLRIFGKGPKEDELKNLVYDMGLSDSVLFCGFSNNVPAEIVKSSAFLLSSDYEGISNSMLEALAMGIPCICTDCPVGGAGMFIKPGRNGYLVPVGDYKTMAEKMMDIIEKPIPAEILKKSSLELRQELSPESIAQKWKECL